MQQQTSGARIPWGIFSIVLIGTFLGPLGGIIVAVALPTISADFGVDLSTAKWVLLVYQVMTTFLLPVMGRLGQRFGEGRLFALGFAIDALGTLGSALVPSSMFGLLIGTRVLQAIGSAFLFALFSAVVARFIPQEKRGLAFGITGAVVAISLVLAPPLGGILCEQFGWRAVFLVQLPLHVFGLIRGWQLLPRDPVGRAEALPAVSLALWLVLVSGLVFIAEALEKGWGLRFVGIASVVTACAVALFAFSERQGRALFSYGLFRVRAFWLGALGMLGLNLTFSVMILLLPFYLEDYLGYSSRHAGMLLCLSPLLTLFSAPLAGGLSDRVGPRWLALGGFASGAAGFGLMGLYGVQGSIPLLAVGLGLLGVAGGLFNGPIISAMMGSAGPDERSHASSLNSLARNLGFVLGTMLSSLLLVLLVRPATQGTAAVASAAAVAVPLDVFRDAAGAIFLGCAALCAGLAIAYYWYPGTAKKSPAPTAS